jgi:hypothetical protein
LAVNRVLKVESAAAAETELPLPSSNVKGWAKVRFLTPSEARSLSLITAWEAPAECRPEARLPASPCENDDLVSTHGPPSGLRPALRSRSSPRATCVAISPEIPAAVSAATLMGTYGWSIS